MPDVIDAGVPDYPTVVVYMLTDARDPDVVRYIGITKRALGVRLKGHMRDANEPKYVDLHRSRWIRKVIAAGSHIEINSFAVVPFEHANSAEIATIAEFRADLGELLTNSTAGGGGCLNPSDETRLKLSLAKKGVPKPPRTMAHKQHIGDTKRGKTLAPKAYANVVAAIRLRVKEHGHPSQSPQVRKKLSLARTQWWAKHKHGPKGIACIAKITATKARRFRERTQS